MAFRRANKIRILENRTLSLARTLVSRTEKSENGGLVIKWTLGGVVQ